MTKREPDKEIRICLIYVATCSVINFTLDIYLIKKTIGIFKEQNLENEKENINKEETHPPPLLFTYII